MGSLRGRRLAALEERLEPASPEDERRTAISHEVHARLTIPELRRYVLALRRMKVGEEPTGDPEAILYRAQELFEEVAQEMLDEWEADARQRLELIEALPPELWYQVYEADDVDEDYGKEAE